MYKKIKDTNFGLGYIRDEYIIAFNGEFDYPGNVKENNLSLETFYDDDAGLTLYNYNNKLCTMKELRREYLKDYYEVK